MAKGHLKGQSPNDHLYKVWLGTRPAGTPLESQQYDEQGPLVRLKLLKHWEANNFQEYLKNSYILFEKKIKYHKTGVNISHENRNYSEAKWTISQKEWGN